MFIIALYYFKVRKLKNVVYFVFSTCAVVPKEVKDNDWNKVKWLKQKRFD